MIQPQRFDELAYALEVQGEYERLVKELSSLNGTLSPQERNHHYNACLVWAKEFNACQVTELARLLKEKLGIPTTLFHRDLHRQEKEERELKALVRQKEDGGEKDSHPLTAYFPGLIDLVEMDGKPVFLALNSEGRPCWNERAEVEGQEVLPPPLEHLPWLLPRGDEVLRHYKELGTRGDSWVYALCGELFDFLYKASEMPTDDYYHELLIPWILIPIC